MNRRYDWVPWQNGSPAPVGTIATGNLRQMTALNIASSTFVEADVVGVVQSQSRFFVHRIVGQYQIFPGEGTSQGAYEIAVMPGLIQVDGATHVVGTTWGFGQFAGVAFAFTPDQQNTEYWYHRQVNDLIGGCGVSSIEHPWWSTIDIKPKRMMETNMVPVFAIRNGTDVDCTFSFQLRMLVTPL